jgi:hypothetical protein
MENQLSVCDPPPRKPPPKAIPSISFPSAILPQSGRQVLGADLNRSESSRWATRRGAHRRSRNMEQSFPGFVAFISAPTGVFIPTSVDITEIAGIIRSIRDPGPTPGLQTVIVIPTNLSAAAPPPGLISNLNLRAYIGGGFSAFGAISIFFGGSAALPGVAMLGLGILANVLVPKELKRLRQERSQAGVLWRAAQDAWQKQSGTQQFADAKRETDALIRSLSDLPNEEKRELQILEQKKREDQLTHYLERFLIANAKIPKIGSGRKAVLWPAPGLDDTRLS